MILASLARYYRRLAAENDEMGNPKVPPYGFSEEKIGWILVLDKEGRLKTVVPNLTADKDEAKARDITAWMCKNFFDIRTFGAVMTTEVNSGQVRGPVQLAFAQSIDPIVPLEVSITRMAVTNEKDLEKERTMGRKYIVPYALYRVHGFISANLAAKTGFSDDDLAKLWQALTLMFEHDRSAARGEMAARKLIVFKHDSVLGSQPTHKLFDAVKVERVNGESGTPASGLGDYKISVVSDGLNGVSVEELL